MAKLLVDNATLTAVQRVLGQIEVSNLYGIDGDITAFESLIQAILFFDDIYYLDDYITKHKLQRREYFARFFPIELPVEQYQELISGAARIADRILPVIQGGRINAGEFKRFIDALRMNLAFTWDLSTSVYYLTIKLLEGSNSTDREKYNKLAAMIFSELQEGLPQPNNLDKRAILLDSKGKPIGSDYELRDRSGVIKQSEISPQLRYFIANLNWLALRTTTYTILSNNLGLSLCLHPIRDAFHANLLDRLEIIDNDTRTTLIKAMNDTGRQTVVSTVMGVQPSVTKQNLPMFLAWLAKNVGDPDSFIEAAYEMRNKEHFMEARAVFDELDTLRDEDPERFTREANKLLRSIDKCFASIREKYHVQTPQGTPLSPIITLWNATSPSHGFPALPNLNAKLPITLKLPDLSSGWGLRYVYRSLTEDLATVPRLGKLHQVITSKVKRSNKASYYPLKTEEDKYFGRESFWKIPM